PTRWATTWWWPSPCACPRSRRSAQPPSSVGRAVPARHASARVRRAPHEIDVAVGVIRDVLGIAVADHQVHGGARATVEHLVAVAAAGGEAGAHAGRQRLLAGVAAQQQLPLEHVYELILVRVPVAHRGLLAGRERRDVDADAREPQGITEAAHLARQD